MSLKQIVNASQSKQVKEPNKPLSKNQIRKRYYAAESEKITILLYSTAADALRNVLQSRKSLEQYVDRDMDVFSKNVHRIVSLTIKYLEEIDYLLKKFSVILESPQQSLRDEFMVKVLIADLLWGQPLSMNSETIRALKFWEEDLREAMPEVITVVEKENTDMFIFPTYLRINTLEISIEEALCAFEKEGWNLLPRSRTYKEFLEVVENLGGNNFLRDHHISELLVFPRKTSFYDHPGYLNGKFLIQDKGSCMSSFLLNPKPGSTTLDYCAAPGMKTNHLANIMNNTGIIYANDIHAGRLNNMNKLLELTKVTCVEPRQSSVFELEVPNSKDVKYILLDPTSTDSGFFFDKDGVSGKFRAIQYRFGMYAKLRHALLNFPNVKRVVYTTNSLFTEEGEEVVDEVMQEIGDLYTLLDVREMLWDEWESVGVSNIISGSKCLRAVPELDHCHGYFIAVFERNFDVPMPVFTKVYKSLKSEWQHELKEVQKAIQNITTDQYESEFVKKSFIKKPIAKKKFLQKHFPVGAKKSVKVREYWKKNFSETKFVHYRNLKEFHNYKRKNKMLSETSTSSCAPSPLETNTTAALRPAESHFTSYRPSEDTITTYYGPPTTNLMTNAESEQTVMIHDQLYP